MSLLDEYCTVTGTPDSLYSCVLNQTDVESNKNKFYIMQLVETNSSSYSVFIRYGRIGEKGVSSIDSYSDKNDAISRFVTQFKSKTGNNFGSSFVKKAGKYFLTETEKPKDADIKNSTIQLSAGLMF